MINNPRAEELWKLFSFVDEDFDKFGESDMSDLIEKRRTELILGLSGVDPEILNELYDDCEDEE